MISGCTNTQQTKTYTGNGFTFNYPANWNDTTLSPELVMGMNYTEMYNATDDLLVIVSNLGSGKDYEGFFVLKKNDAKASESILGSLTFLGNNPQAWASNQKQGLINSTPHELISEKQTTVDGNTAYQFTLKNTMGNYYITFVYFTKNNIGYCLEYQKYGSDDQQTLENIIKSFKFQ